MNSSSVFDTPVYNDLHKSRGQVIKIVFVLAAVTLLGRILFLQLVTDEYRNKAQATAIHKYMNYPARGVITDRNGNLLVANEPVFELMVTAKQIDPAMDTLRFCQLLGISKVEFEKAMDKDFRNDPRYSRSVPFVFQSRIPVETYARLQESLYEFPGFFIQMRNVRTYPNASAAHLLGYINEVDQARIEASEGAYVRGDYIGVSGLELVYEKELRGEKGFDYVLKDNLGRIVGKYEDEHRNKPAIGGIDFQTTLDINLQHYGETLMNGKVGAIIAISPDSGQILAMVSAPHYDPNMLTIRKDRSDFYRNLVQDTLKPLFNRASMAKYPPGSIFKTVVALLGQQAGVLNADDPIDCDLGYYYNGRLYGCHDHPMPRNIATAIQHSCNSYFFQVLRRLVDKYGYENPEIGLDSFIISLQKFGLGAPLGADISAESPGFLPDSRFYDRLYPKEKGEWRSPYIMSIGIGQGEVELTTLQMANLAAIIANKGCYHTPHLIRNFSDGRALPEAFRSQKCTGVDTSYFQPVIDGMEKAVISGTAGIARIPGIEVCGKTGTSQNPHGEDHSVFFAFAPKENPRIAIAVYVENGGWGATYGAPIASLMIEKYLNGTISPRRKWLENRMLESNLISMP